MIIKQQILSIIAMQSLLLPDKSLYNRAFDLYITKNISYADAYNAVYLQAEEITHIYSWDRDFNKIDGIARLEPTIEEEKG